MVYFSNFAKNNKTMFDFLKRCFKYKTVRELIDSYKQPESAVTVEKVADNHIKATIDIEKALKSPVSKKQDEGSPRIPKYPDESLAHHIRFVICGVIKIIDDPWPEHAFAKFREVLEHHAIVQNANLDDVRKNSKLINKYWRDCNVDVRHFQMLDEYASSPTSFDPGKILKTTIDKFFHNYKPYWETQISNLKRSHAIINRRKYLIEKCDYFTKLLQDLNIYEYHDMLQEYQKYNADQLTKLEMSKNFK